MVIAYFLDAPLSSFSGIVQSTLNIAWLLAENNHKIVIFAPKKNTKGKNIISHPNISIEYVPSLPSLFNKNLRISSPLPNKLVDSVKKYSPDILHSHHAFLISLNSLMIGRLLKIPNVTTFHAFYMDLNHLGTIGITKPKEKISDFLWNYTRFFYNQFDCIITPTRTVREDLKANQITKPIYTISNTINEAQANYISKSQLQTFKKDLRLKVNVILYVGRLSHEKNVELIIEAFSYIVKNQPESTLVIIGDGPSKKKLKGLAKKLKTEKDILFTGAISNSNLLQKGYYQLANVFVMGGASETQGISILEAMYFGVPIVGVVGRGSEELIGEVGILVERQNPKDFANAIIMLLKQKSLQKQLGEKSKQILNSKYNQQKIMKEYENLYSNIVSQKKGGEKN